MTQKVDVSALARLARLDVAPEELARLETEIPAILGFVEQIQEVTTSTEPAAPEHRNIMREDIDPIETGLHTEELLAAAPSQRDSLVVVKQVLSKKQ